ncbi:hypothetical protein CLOBAR_02324 [Intestinibacter bartlettii DSM 16795]|nr:hypothetical protein CLOBAR_02324 [Intestinibacter bartlettii DSM 16795]
MGGCFFWFWVECWLLSGKALDGWSRTWVVYKIKLFLIPF